MTETIPIFPTDLPNTFPLIKKPFFSTINQAPASRRDVGRYQRVYSGWEFELMFDGLRDRSPNQIVINQTRLYTQAQALLNLYCGVGGPVGCFCYYDPDDYSRSQTLGTGDGTTTEFLFYRGWGEGALSLVEPVGIVNVQIGATLDIFVNSAPVSQTGNWWIDSDLRTLVFKVAPASGAVISAHFEFFYLCRFVDKDLPLVNFLNGYWQVDKLRFRTTTPNVANSLSNYVIENQNTALTTPQ